MSVPRPRDKIDMLLFLTVVLAAVIFEYSNGFHDAANAIATVVSTKVLTPRQAIAMAAFFQFNRRASRRRRRFNRRQRLVDAEVVTMLDGCWPRSWPHSSEHDHVVVRFAFELEPRAHRRTVRRGFRDRARKLVGH